MTAEGRGMLRRVQAYIEANVAGAKVIYGDTDSVFVCIDGQTLTRWEMPAR